MGCDKGRTGKCRQDDPFGPVQPSIGCSEARANHAFLNPDITLVQDPIRGQTRQLGAGTGAAG